MPQAPRLRIIAGPNGSGKSTLLDFLKKIVDLGPVFNPDTFEKELNQKGRLSISRFGLSIDEIQMREHFGKCGQLQKYADHKAFLEDVKIHKKSVRIPKRHINGYVAASISDFLRKEMIRTGNSYTFETVMSHNSKLEIIKLARSKGFRTYLYFISTRSPVINEYRIRQRVRQGGHAVPQEKIRPRYFRSLNLLSRAIKLVDRAFLFDNSEKEMLWFVEIESGIKIDYKVQGVPNWFDKYVIRKRSA